MVPSTTWDDMIGRTFLHLHYSWRSMTNPHVLQSVRDTLARWLSNRHPGEQFSARESILIRDGFYCGRRFDFGDYQAVWFVEEGMIKVFSSTGDLISRIVVQEQQAVQSHRRAA